MAKSLNLIALLVAKKNNERLTAIEVASILDVEEQKVNSWIKRVEKNPKVEYEDGVKIVKWLNGNTELNKNKLNLVGEEPAFYNKMSSSDKLLDVIEKLTNTNAEQQKTIGNLVDKLGNADAQTKVG